MVIRADLRLMYGEVGRNLSVRKGEFIQIAALAYAQASASAIY